MHAHEGVAGAHAARQAFAGHEAQHRIPQVRRIYDTAIAHLRESMLRFVAGESLPGRVRAC
ncbi:MAG: hypothetical protein EOO29_45275, partial [Comamonadaceae bacterium]